MKRIFYFYINFLLFAYFSTAENLIVVPSQDGGDAAIKAKDPRYAVNAKTYFLGEIGRAEKTIDLTIYQLDDVEMINALIIAKKRGVSVRLITEARNLYSHDENLGAEKNKKSAISQMQNAGIEIKGLPYYLLEKSPKQAQAHYKLLVVDNKCAILMSCNWDDPTLKRTRDFALRFDEIEIIQSLKKVFDADWCEKPLNSHGNCYKNIYVGNIELPQLVLGPDADQREIFISLCKSAKQSIRIYNQSFNAKSFVSSLCDFLTKIKINTELLMLEFPFSKTKNGNLEFQREFQSAGGKVYFNDERYIHAKVIIIDDRYAYIGSCNIYGPSFEFNRELGWITNNQEVIRKLIELFERDKRYSRLMPAL